VIATQNPMDHAGTFPLPESQLDRFTAVVHLGYADPLAERRVLLGEAGSARLDSLAPALDLAGWTQARTAVQAIQLSDALLDYLERMVARLRQEGAFCSTRAVTQWLSLARAEAWLEGRAFVTPDDLQSTFCDAMAHRGSMDDRRLNRDERRAQLSRLVKDVHVGWAH